MATLTVSCGSSGTGTDSFNIYTQIWNEALECMSETVNGHDLIEPKVVYDDVEFAEICGDQKGRLGCYDFHANRIIVREEYRFETAETQFDYEVREGIVEHEDIHAILWQADRDLSHEHPWFDLHECENEL